MQIIPVKITTLTPIWTGGVNRECDRLHETGIIGSLRWWYEALIRSLGGSACDPTDSKARTKTIALPANCLDAQGKYIHLHIYSQLYIIH